MSQSALLVGLLAVAFLLYVAAKGRLPVYTNVLWGPKPSGTSGSGTGASASKSSGPSTGDVVKLALDAAELAGA